MNRPEGVRDFVTSRFKLFIPVLTIVSIGVVYFLLRGHEPVPKNDLSGLFHFHPDSVMRLKWKSGGVDFEFRRNSRRDPWAPTTDPTRIQEKLNTLSTIAVVDVPEKIDGRVEFEIEFAPGNSWSGVSDGTTFVWTSGLLKGKGAKFDEKNARWFREGRFSFAPNDWNWCKKRPKRIAFEIEGEKYELHQDGLQWKLKSKKGEKALDPTTIENWLGRNCSDRIIASRDLDSFPVDGARGVSSSVFEIEYTDGQKDRARVLDGYVEVEEDRAIEPQNLLGALKALTSIPD